MMKYGWLVLSILLVPVLGRAQGTCTNLALGGGFTCVQAPNPVANGATVPNNIALLSFAANTTPGNGVLIFGYLCTANPCASTPNPPASVTVTDDAVPADTGWQPCTNNGSSGNGVRFWYCWWLPAVGSAKTFTMHANASYNAALWIAEISGACNTTNCIDNDVPAVFCLGPCGAPVTTQYTNDLVAGAGFLAGTVLATTAPWKVMACTLVMCGIGNLEAAAAPYQPYTPTFTNAVMLQALSVAIKSRSASVISQVTVPTMPVF